MTEEETIEKAKKNLFLLAAVSRGYSIEEAKQVWDEETKPKKESDNNIIYLGYQP